jgi:hypothetical protein
MAVYVYCGKQSDGARALVEALGAKRLRRFDGRDFWQGKERLKIKEGDSLICWGSSFPEIDGVKVLNSAPSLDPYTEINHLIESGIRTVEVVKHKSHIAFSSSHNEQDWLRRLSKRSSGSDLLNPPPEDVTDYWVKREQIVKEYRIHVFLSRTIKSGVKAKRSADAHPWIRTFDAGWYVNYDNFQSTSALKSLARKAVAALNLDFGAVDIGETANGNLVVFGVNRSPAMGENTLAKYTEKIKGWMDGSIIRRASTSNGNEGRAARPSAPSPGIAGIRVVAASGAGRQVGRVYLPPRTQTPAEEQHRSNRISLERSIAQWAVEQFTPVPVSRTTAPIPPAYDDDSDDEG